MARDKEAEMEWLRRAGELLKEVQEEQERFKIREKHLVYQAFADLAEQLESHGIHGNR